MQLAWTRPWFALQECWKNLKEASTHGLICAHLDNEIRALKEQVERLTHENGTVKRAVVIQLERQKEYENKERELQLLRDELVPQYKEKLRMMEVNMQLWLVNALEAGLPKQINSRGISSSCLLMSSIYFFCNRYFLYDF
jgi:predicted RNase H-like nuclease (RuvC/YqgF family)